MRADDGETPSLNKARRKLYDAQRRKLELELAQKEGEFVQRRDVVATLEAAFTGVRAKLLAIPKKLAPQLVGLDSLAEIESILEAEAYDCCSELADPGTWEARLRGDSARDPGLAPAAPSPRKRVGRPRKKTQRRGKRRARPVADK